MVAGKSPSESLASPASPAIYRFGNLDPRNVVHGITTRDSAMPLNGNFSYMVGDDPDAVWENRSVWGRAIGFDAARLVLGRQVHETTVAVVDSSHAGSGADSVETSLRRVDGVITDTVNLPIGVAAADCVPLLIHDPVAGAVGAIHAGWRGTVNGIVTEAVRRFESAFASDSNNLKVGMGPAICQSCYQVGPEVVEIWSNNPSYRHADAVTERDAGLHFDLRAANFAQLVDAGVLDDNIEVSPVCTRCSDGAMFSRRGLGPRTGLFAAIIMLRGDGDETAWGEQ